jgi:hypothetical protein
MRLLALVLFGPRAGSPSKADKSKTALRFYTCQLPDGGESGFRDRLPKFGEVDIELAKMGVAGKRVDG